MKKRSKSILLLLTCSAALMFFNPFTATTSHAQTSTISLTITSEIKPRMDKTEWRYKIIDGKLYRRLFNLTSNTWISDWELVG